MIQFCILGRYNPPNVGNLVNGSTVSKLTASRVSKLFLLIENLTQWCAISSWYELSSLKVFPAYPVFRMTFVKVLNIKIVWKHGIQSRNENSSLGLIKFVNDH